MDILITVVLLSLISFFAYKLFTKRSKNSEQLKSLSEDDLKPFFATIDVVNEEKVRKQWLSTLYISGMFMIIGILTQCCGEKVDNMISYVYLFCYTIGYFLSSISLLWVIYHFSYKKRGTALLKFIMIIIPVLLIFGLIVGHDLKLFGSGAVSYYSFFMSSVINTYYWISCFRLHKVNSQRKRLRSLALNQKQKSEANICQTSY